MLNFLEGLSTLETERLRRLLTRTSMLALILWLYTPTIFAPGSAFDDILTNEQLDALGVQVYWVFLLVIIVLSVRYILHWNAIRETLADERAKVVGLESKRQDLDRSFASLVENLQRHCQEISEVKTLQDTVFRYSYGQEFYDQVRIRQLQYSVQEARDRLREIMSYSTLEEDSGADPNLLSPTRMKQAMQTVRRVESALAGYESSFTKLAQAEEAAIDKFKSAQNGALMITQIPLSILNFRSDTLDSVIDHDRALSNAVRNLKSLHTDRVLVQWMSATLAATGMIACLDTLFWDLAIRSKTISIFALLQ
jgi:hypothetical protein